MIGRVYTSAHLQMRCKCCISVIVDSLSFLGRMTTCRSLAHHLLLGCSH